MEANDKAVNEDKPGHVITLFDWCFRSLNI